MTSASGLLKPTAVAMLSDCEESKKGEEEDVSRANVVAKRVNRYGSSTHSDECRRIRCLVCRSILISVIARK